MPIKGRYRKKHLEKRVVNPIYVKELLKLVVVSGKKVNIKNFMKN